MNRLSRALIVLIMLTTCGVSSAEVTVPQLTNLQQISAQAKLKNLPILLVVSQHECPFCKLLKREVLNPMMVSGDYVDQAVIVELLMDDSENIINREGKSVYPGSIAADYHVWVTPTLLFIDHQGKEVEKRMLGVNTIEMYGYYLDESIKRARKAVKQGEPYNYKVNKQDINQN